MLNDNSDWVGNHGLVSRGSTAVRTVIDCFEDQVNDLLHNLVPRGSDTERSQFPIRLWDIFPSRGFELEALISRWL